MAGGNLLFFSEGTGFSDGVSGEVPEGAPGKSTGWNLDNDRDFSVGLGDGDLGTCSKSNQVHLTHSLIGSVECGTTGDCDFASTFVGCETDCVSGKVHGREFKSGKEQQQNDWDNERKLDSYCATPAA